MDRRRLLTALLGMGLTACGVGVRERPGASPGGTPPDPTADAPSPGSPTAEPGATVEQAEGGSADEAEGTVTLPLVCREAWGAAPARGSLDSHEIGRLMVHHDAVVLTDNRGAPARLRQHQRFHLERGWGDIAYHVAVDRHGHAYELRDPAAPGDTATDYDPSGWFLAVGLGNFDEQAPTERQLEGLARVLAWAAGRHGTTPAVAAHRAHAATRCPGEAMMAALDGLGRRTRALAGEVRVTRLCGAAGRERVAAIEDGRL